MAGITSISSRLAGLRYRAGDRLVALPEWARFMITLGRCAATFRVEGRRSVAGLSVPTRAFAAAFCAAGAVAALYDGVPATDAREHFEQLARLPRGTPLRYRTRDYLCSGRLVGCEVRPDGEYLALQNGPDGYKRRWDKCAEMQPLASGEGLFQRRKLAPAPGFLRCALPGAEPNDYAAWSRLDCLLIGFKEALRDELCGAEMWSEGGGLPPQRGCLQDILRCHALTPNPNDHFRSDLLPAYASEVPERLKDAQPPLVVLDGAPAFLRWRAQWPASPIVLILDRTSPSAQAAADAFNQERAASIRDARIPGLPALPAGVELLAFLEEAG